jgi:hypothetical protein
MSKTGAKQRNKSPFDGKDFALFRPKKYECEKYVSY